jgi:hypothetical protein
MVGLRLLEPAAAVAVVAAEVAAVAAVAVGVLVGIGMDTGVSAAFWASVKLARVTEQPLAG